MSEAPERIWVHAVTGETYTEKPEKYWEYNEYVRADLLPVVKPLEWAGESNRKIYSDCGLYKLLRDEGGYPYRVIFVNRALTGDNGKVLWFDTVEDAVDAANAHNATRIRTSFDMIDPAALVAGAYQAAAMEFDGWDNVPVQMTYDEARCRIRALTPADAQAALDAAIAKAVNVKLEEVVRTVVPMVNEIAGTPHHAGCGQIVAAILAMKEPE